STSMKPPAAVGRLPGTATDVVALGVSVMRCAVPVALSKRDHTAVYLAGASAKPARTAALSNTSVPPSIRGSTMGVMAGRYARPVAYARLMRTHTQCAFAAQL